MKQTPPQGEQPNADPAEPGQPTSLAGRFRLAMLDEHQGERPGYNPYDTPNGGKRDVWRSKRKRA